MGDILHALPAVTALRKRHPEWFMGWAVEPQWQSLLAACDAPARMAAGERSTMPLVDRIHHVPAKKWARSPISGDTLGDIASIRRELRAAQYDVCIDLQGAVRSAILGRMAKTTRMIGEANPREPLARRFFQEKVDTLAVHVIDQAIEVANSIAADRLGFTLPLLPRSPQAEAWCDRTIARGQPLILINPGAGWGAKRWPAERYAEVARGLRDLGLRALLNYGPGEEELVRSVEAASGGTALAIRCSITELIALTRRASLFIGGDTGPLHLAAALRVPVVAIFGPTDPARNGPYGTRCVVLRNAESVTSHKRRAAADEGMLGIGSAAVLAAAAAIRRSG